MNKYIYIIAITLFSWGHSYAQSEEKVLLNEGVEAFNKGDFSEALSHFNKSYEKNSNYTKALFDAANAAFLLDSIKNAKDLFAEYISISDNKIDKSKGYYNLGNIAFKEYEKLASTPEKSQDAVKKLKESIDFYKKALRNNPNDKDARYNLSLAMSKLPPPNQDNQQNNQQNQDNKNDQQNQDNKDQQNKGDNQDKKDGQQGDKDQNKGDKGDQDENKGQDGENQDEKDGDKKDEQGKNGDNGDEKDKQQGNKGEQQGKEGEKGEDEMKGKISRMQATKDLDAMNNNEQKVLMKVNRKKGKDKSEVKSSKDW